MDDNRSFIKQLLNIFKVNVFLVVLEVKENVRTKFSPGSYINEINVRNLFQVVSSI